MNHIFGPVNSRRLGRSLGVDLFTEKICNLNCIYCEVGTTRRLTCQRDQYVPTGRILAEIDTWFGETGRQAEIDVVTVTASGEPTLHSGFGEILAHIKACSGKPVCVLTNGTTLMDPQVRQELALADIAIPSLDAARESSFRKLDRPAGCVHLDEVIRGLIAFSHEYSGRLWLEILFARGINDSDQDVEALQEVIGRMRLERIQLNTVARPPLEEYARPSTGKRLADIARFFRQNNPGCRVDILAVGAPTGKGTVQEQDARSENLVQEIAEMLKRRPCTAADIETVFHCGGQKRIAQLLKPLIESGNVRTRSYGDRLYYTWNRNGEKKTVVAAHPVSGAAAPNNDKE